MRVFLTLMSWSNKSKSCMRVGRREFVQEFFELSFSVKARVAWKLIKIANETR